MNDFIHIDRAISPDDIDQLKNLYKTVFSSEAVDILANILTLHHPVMDYGNWVVARDTKKHNRIIAGLAAIPWSLEFRGIPLKAMEQGIVGTHPDYRGRGIMRRLNNAFDDILAREKCDIAIIQGIPNFYSKFGFRFALELENHINLELDRIGNICPDVAIRKADISDIAFLAGEEKKQHDVLDICCVRSTDIWEYLLGKSRETEYGSDIYIIREEAYMRVQYTGFGKGLIISEISENISERMLDAALVFLKKLAEENEKPYLRFSLCSFSAVVQKLFRRGAVFENYYGWQVKIPDRQTFVRKFRIPLCASIPSDIRLTLSTGKEDLRLESPPISGNSIKEITAVVPDDLVEPLLLGYRSFAELNYVRPECESFEEGGKSVMDVSFQKRSCWLNSQY